MGARRHGQGGTCPPPSGNVVKCFGASVMTVKGSVDELFTHYLFIFKKIHQLLDICPLPQTLLGSVYGPSWGPQTP